MKREIDNLLNKLGKKLDNIRSTFGTASEEYQTLAIRSDMILRKYGNISDVSMKSGSHIRINRKDVKLTGQALADYEKELHELERAYAAVNVKKARARYAEAAKNQNMLKLTDAGMSKKEARKQAKATPKQIREIAESQMDLDMAIEAALDWLYHEDMRVKYEITNPNDAYKIYFRRVEPRLIGIMKQKGRRKSHIELRNVIDSVYDLVRVRGKLEGRESNKMQKVMDAEYDRLDKIIRRAE